MVFHLNLYPQSPTLDGQNFMLKKTDIFCYSGGIICFRKATFPDQRKTRFATEDYSTAWLWTDKNETKDEVKWQKLAH